MKIFNFIKNLFTKPKLLETLRGHINYIDGDIAYITLKSLNNDNVFYGQYSYSKFLKKGIDEDSSFLVQTFEVGENLTKMEITLIPNVDLTEEDIQRIRDKIGKFLPKDCDLKY